MWDVVVYGQLDRINIKTSLHKITLMGPVKVR